MNHLTEHGVMDASLFYESPFTDVTPQGPDGILALFSLTNWLRCWSMFGPRQSRRTAGFAVPEPFEGV